MTDPGTKAARRVQAPCAGNTAVVVVTYHPCEQVCRRIRDLRSQVSHLIVVDNGSDQAERRMLRSLLQDDTSIELIQNDENLGVGVALNQAAARALELEKAWLLCMDQDSQAGEDLLAQLGRIHATYPHHACVGMIGSNYVDATGRPAFGCRDPKAPCQQVPTVITSGSLLSLEAYRCAGPFREDFFIDSVDHEYCLRLRSCLFEVAISCTPLLNHALGNQVRYRVPFFRLAVSHHSPLRRYYMTRNRLALARAYFRCEPLWVGRDLAMMLFELCFVLLLEPGRGLKLRAFLTGLGHGLWGPMGRCRVRGLEGEKIG